MSRPQLTVSQVGVREAQASHHTGEGVFSGTGLDPPLYWGHVRITGAPLLSQLFAGVLHQEMLESK